MSRGTSFALLTACLAIEAVVAAMVYRGGTRLEVFGWGICLGVLIGCWLTNVFVWIRDQIG